MNSVPPRILVVDDKPENLIILSKLLRMHGYEAVSADDGQKALALAATVFPELILLDIMMPDLDGFETCRLLKENPETREIPVIFMSALSEVTEKVKGLTLGAVDYVTKPFEMEELLGRIETHLSLRRLHRALEQKNTQLEYTLAEQAALLNNVPAGIAFVGLDRRVLQINARLEEMFGYSSAELIGQSEQRLYCAEADYQRVGWEGYPVLRQGQIYETEIMLCHRDGRRFWGRLRGKAVGPENAVQGFVWSLEDMSQRKQAEDELRLAAKVFETISDAVLITDPGNRIVTVNPAFSAITGYSREDVLGKNPKLLSSGRHDQNFYQAMWHSLLHQGQWRGEVWDRRKDGAVYPIWLSISAIRRPDEGIANYLAVFSDITRRKQVEDTLHHQANYDALTGLPNRILFQDRLSNALARAHRHHKRMALLYVDLDGFKQINDRLGHEAGDSVLVQVARLLPQCIREDDTAARLGGDEFAVILHDLESAEWVHGVARRILDRLDTTVEKDGETLPLSASVGIALYPQHGADQESLLRQADQAMYQAKRLGKNTYCQVEMPPGALPAEPAQAAGPQEAQVVELKPAHTPLRLLYIEDNPYFSNLVQMVLETEGYRVDLAETGAEGMERLHAGTYDLVLVDYQLDDTDGLHLLRQIRGQRPALPVIMVTGEGDEGVAVEAMKEGAADYLRKDGEFTGLLLSALARALTLSKLAEAERQAREARQREELYRNVFDSAFIALLILDLQGRIVDANATSCKLFEYAREELSGLNGKALLHPDAYPLFEQCKDLSREFRAEATMMSKHGSRFYVEAYRTQINYRDQPHLLLIMRDITAQRAAEARLHRFLEEQAAG